MSTTIQISPPAELREIDFPKLQAIAAIPEGERYAHAASMDLPTLGRFIQPAVNCAEALVAAYRPYILNFRERTAHQGEQRLLVDDSGKQVTRDELCRQTIGVGIRRLNQLLKVTDPDALKEEDSPKPKPTKKTGHAREGEFSVEKLEDIYRSHPEVQHYFYARDHAYRWLSKKFGEDMVGDFDCDEGDAVDGDGIDAFMKLWDAYGRPLNIDIDETYFDWAWKELGCTKTDKPTMTVAQFIDKVIELEKPEPVTPTVEPDPDGIDITSPEFLARAHGRVTHELQPNANITRQGKYVPTRCGLCAMTGTHTLIASSAQEPTCKRCQKLKRLPDADTRCNPIGSKLPKLTVDETRQEIEALQLQDFGVRETSYQWAVEYGKAFEKEARRSSWHGTVVRAERERIKRMIAARRDL